MLFLSKDCNSTFMAICHSLAYDHFKASFMVWGKSVEVFFWRCRCKQGFIILSLPLICSINICIGLMCLIGRAKELGS